MIFEVEVCIVFEPASNIDVLMKSMSSLRLLFSVFSKTDDELTGLSLDARDAVASLGGPTTGLPIFLV